MKEKSTALQNILSALKKDTIRVEKKHQENENNTVIHSIE
jgi:hypothetical protein